MFLGPTIHDADDLRRRIDAKAYATFLFVSFFIGIVIDSYVIEPFMGWLREVDFPIWWITWLEQTLSIPLYIIGEEQIPHWWNVMISDGSPWWMNVIAVCASILSVIAIFTYPFAVMIMCIVSAVLGGIALGIEVFHIVWPYMLAGLGLWALQGLFKMLAHFRREKRSDN